MLALTVFEILTFQIFYLQKVRHGRGVQSLQCCHSMTNIKIYKGRPMHFALALTVSRILIFHIFTFKSR